MTIERSRYHSNSPNSNSISAPFNQTSSLDDRVVHAGSEVFISYSSSDENSSYDSDPDSIEYDPYPHSESSSETEAEKPGTAAKIVNYVGGTRLCKMLIGSDWVSSMMKSWGIGSCDYSDKAAKYKKRIDNLVHHNNFTELIEFAMPLLSGSILESISSQVQNTGLESFIKKEKKYLETLIKALIYKVIGNFTEQAIASWRHTHKVPPESDIATLVIEYLLDYVYHLFEMVDKRKYQEYSQIADQNLSKLKLRKLMIPRAQELLEIAFPKGVAELELNIGSPIWSALQKRAIPDLLIEVYRLTSSPAYVKAEDKAALMRPGGGCIQAFTAFISRHCQNLGRIILSKNNDKFAEKLLDFLEVNVEEHADLQHWLSARLQEISDSKAKSVEKLSGSFALNIQEVLMHVLGTLADPGEGNDQDQNVIPLIAQKALDLIYRFAVDKHDEISLAIEQYAPHPNIEEADEILTEEHFAPFSDQLIKLVRLDDDPIISWINKHVFPKIFLDFYRDMIRYRASVADASIHLRQRLFDEEELLNVPNLQRESNFEEAVRVRGANCNGEELFWKLAGITHASESLEEICGTIAQKLRVFIERYAREHSDALAAFISTKLPPDFKFSSNDEKDLAKGIAAFINDPNNEAFGPTLDYIKSLIEAMLFKLLAAVAENTENIGEVPVGENRNSLIASSLMNKLQTILGRHFTLIQEQLQKLNAEELDEEENREEIRKLFLPLSCELLLLAGEEWKELIPVPNLLKELLEELIKEQFLPLLIYDIYNQSYGWIAQAEEMEAQLDATFPSGNAKEAVRAIGQYIEEYIPYVFEVDSEKVANVVVKYSQDYLQHMPPKQRKKLRQVLSANIREIGTDKANSTMWNAISVYAEAIVLKVVSGISKEIELNERVRGVNGESTFLLDTVVNVMNVAKDHFVAISNIPKKGRRSQAHRVPHSAMLVGFIKAKQLHPALFRDVTGTEEERKEDRLKYFYQPLAKNLIQLAGIKSSEEFPIPGLVKEEAWNLFQDKIMPEVLMSIFNDILGPRNMNKLMLKAIDYLNSKIEDIEEDPYIEDDLHQRTLNEACGEIIKSMVNLIPQIFTKTVIPADKLKRMTAEQLGGLVRRKLQATSMLELMDSLLGQINLPDPQEPVWKDPEALAKHDNKIEKELKRKMTKYISKQVKAKMRSAMKKKWARFQFEFDRTIRKVMGTPGVAIKLAFDLLFRFVFFTLLGPLFDFIFFRILWFFVDTVISRKSIELIYDAQMPIHPNLVLRATEEWINLMNRAKEKRLTEDSHSY